MEDQITGKVVAEAEFFEQPLVSNFKNIYTYKLALESAVQEEMSLVLKNLMTGAILLGFSDLHLEIEEKGSMLRVRIDGSLHQACVFTPKVHHNIVSRIKLLAGLKLNIEKAPQDGRFTVVLNRPEGVEEIEIRVSTIPTAYGENIVMRVLNPKSLISLEELGLRSDLFALFERQAKKPNGMIIVTGPTGSGKTTTLYAFLKKIRSSENKVITIEDPIEYHLDGITQTQINQSRGYDFASGLRSIVRQDPDAILVGEIRDLETASIALQAALTGHLVLSTLHTNNAAGTIARLQALGEIPVNIAPALNMVVAQRLVRKVCPHCSTKQRISAELFTEIKEGFKTISPNIPLPAFSENSEILVPSPKGCEFCNFTGFKGRIALFEAIEIDDEMEDFILTSPSIPALERLAIQKGATLMKQDGYMKILNGITTIEEVVAVTG
ncbi:MAG: GspE/PulE family protein [Candidatus Paceibacterota bacterium]|jgi:type II secretory ATPase GspE/PulE/Tfp pilus assembly ATPase PilB-like protein|nr:GspE/PulE family protein [bacterium]